MIDGVCFESERGRFWSGFGFGRDIVGGTGARAVISFHLLFCFQYLLFACCIMSYHVGNKLC